MTKIYHVAPTNNEGDEEIANMVATNRLLAFVRDHGFDTWRMPDGSVKFEVPSLVPGCPCGDVVIFTIVAGDYCDMMADAKVKLGY